MLSLQSKSKLIEMEYLASLVLIKMKIRDTSPNNDACLPKSHQGFSEFYLVFLNETVFKAFDLGALLLLI